MKVHRLKTLAGFWDEVMEGNKTAEVRHNDRDFQKDDALILVKVDELGVSTFNEIRVIVTHVLSGWGLKEGYVMLSFRKEDSHGT